MADQVHERGRRDASNSGVPRLGRKFRKMREWWQDLLINAAGGLLGALVAALLLALAARAAGLFDPQRIFDARVFVGVIVFFAMNIAIGGVFASVPLPNAVMTVLSFAFLASAWAALVRLRKMRRPEQTTKECPDCRERVRYAANVCRYCGHRFST